MHRRIHHVGVRVDGQRVLVRFVQSGSQEIVGVGLVHHANGRQQVEDAREEQSFLLKSFVSPRPHFRRCRGFIKNPLETMLFFLFLFFTSQSLQEIASQLASLAKSERAHNKFALRCSSAIYADNKRVALE